MKIYLASRYSRLSEMRGYRAELESAGHVVTSRWVNGNHEGDNAVRFAQEDYDDLLESDCVVSFTQSPDSSTSRGGRHVEYGIALARGKRVIVVGYRENVFHHLPEVEFFANWEEALRNVG